MKKRFLGRIFKIPTLITLTAILILSGFLVANAIANGNVTATVNPEAVDINQTADLNFNVNSGLDPIVQVEIDYASAAFTLAGAFSCPSGWTTNSTIPGKIICSVPTVNATHSIGILLNSTSPASNGDKTFPITVTTYATGYTTYNISATVQVKTLSAAASVLPATTNTGQIRDYAFTFNNTGEDAITKITATIPDFVSVNTCSAVGFLSCIPSGNSFTLSGGSLASAGNVNISANATAPSAIGVKTPSFTITGALGGTATFSGSNSITVQTPANLSAGDISSDIARISKNPGAYNTAIVSVTITNGGQATANTLVKSLVIKNNTSEDISSKFTITETTESLAITEITGGASPTLSWTVIAKSGDEGPAEGLDKATVSVGYNDINTGAAGATSPATQINSGIFTVDNTAPTLSITAPLSGNKVNASAVIAFTNNSDLTPNEAVCSVDNTNWTDCATGVTALSAISQFAGLAQGAFTLYVKDADLAGNTGADSEAGIIKDTEAPTFSSITALPSPAKFGTEVTVTFTASETLLSNPTVTIGGGAASRTDVTEDLEYTYSRVLDGTETTPTATVSISGTDLAGNVGADTSKSIATDFTAPTVNLTYNPDRPVRNADNVTITATFSENLNGTPKISINTPTTDVENLDMTGSGMVWTYLWDVPAGDGSAIITITASDPAGNPNSMATNNTRVIDNTKPNSTINSPAASSWHNIDFVVNVSDTDSNGVAEQYYRVYSDLNSDDDFTDSGEMTKDWTSRSSGDITITVGDGKDCRAQGLNRCKVQVKAIDNAGNDNWVSPWKNVIVSIDWTAPVTTKTISPTTPDGLGGWYKTAPTIILSATDAVSNINKKYYKWDDATTYTEYPGTITAPEGTHTFWFYSDDIAGNSETPVSQQFKVDTTPLTMQLITPVKGSALSGTQQFVFDFSDENLAYLEFDIYGPIPYNTVDSKIQTMFAPNESNPYQHYNKGTGTYTAYTPTELALFAEMGVSAFYDAINQKWTITVDTTKKWTTTNPWGQAVGSPVWPDGQYKFYIEVGDFAGNKWGDMMSPPDYMPYIYIFDNTAPVITLTGAAVMELETGQTYTDAGATASDNIDGNITANIIVVNPVNTSVVGAYTVTYNVSDVAGNLATPVTRTINVVAPTLINMTASNVSQKEDLNFEASINSKGNVKDSAKDNLVRFYGVIPGLNSADIVFSGSNIPEVVTDSTERTAVGASATDLVLAWGPAGGFPISANENAYESAVGLTSTFTAKIANPGTYNVRFVFYDLTGNKVINGAGEGMVITISSDITNLQMTADPISVKQGQGFSATITAQGNVKDTELSNMIRFYGIIPGISAGDLSFTGGNQPQVVTDTTERTAVGADTTDLVLAWGPAGGFPIGTYESLYETTGVPTQFDGDMTLSASVGSYSVGFVVYDFTKSVSSSAGSVILTIIDGIAPQLTSVNIASNNTKDTSLAKPGDVITISLVANENITEPTVTIAGNSATVSGSGTSWTATYTMVEGDTAGVVAFTIDFVDVAGNAGIPVTAVADNSSVTFDKTAPATTLAINPVAPNGTNDWYITSAPTITLTCADQTGLSGCGAISYKWDSAESYSTYSSPLTAPEGTHTLYYYSTDSAGNSETAVTSAAIKVDLTNPTVSLLSPLVGSKIIGGSTAYISWTAGDANLGNTPIKLEYSINGPTNNGNPWPVIIEATNHNPIGEHSISEYVWTVPNLTSPSCYVRITATDLAGNSVTKDIGPFTISRNNNPTPICTQVGNTDQLTCDISLNIGWNLISSPVVINNGIATVLSAISSNVNVAQYYNSGSWMFYIPGNDASTLTTIEDGKGYWIYMNSADTLTLIGLANPKVEAGTLIPSTYSVNSNDWNLVGFRSVGNMNAKEYVDHYITGAFGKDYIMWKYENGKSLEPLYSTGDMKSGYGYWLYTR